MGSYHACVVLADGRVQCWGRNVKGALGSGTTGDADAPVDVVDLSGAPLSGGQHVSAGALHTCAALDGGKVMCWGDNSYGQIGDGTTVTPPGPTEVEGLVGAADPVVRVSVRHNTSCAVHSSGRLSCWGYNGYDELGLASSGSHVDPTTVNGVQVRAVGAGDQHQCVIDPTRQALCWGSGAVGQIDNSLLFNPAPVAIAGFANASALTVGANHACIIDDTTQQVSCWGSDSSGQRGEGLDGFAVIDVSAGRNHTCAVLEGGGVMCWGRNIEKQLGQLPYTNREPPLAVPEYDNARTAVAVATGANHSCAVDSTNEVLCWGQNARMQLGDAEKTPIAGLPSGQAILDIDAGNEFNCVATSVGVYCWGANEWGQLGSGPGVRSASAVAVTDLPTAQSPNLITAGAFHACTVTTDGELWCWGQNSYGQLGNGNRSPTSGAVFVLDNVVTASAGTFHTCAQLADDRVQCWGQNVLSQLGTRAPFETQPQFTIGFP